MIKFLLKEYFKNMTNKNKTSKVLFRVSDGEGGTNVETLWTSDLGNDKYKMDNSPFYAYSVSWNDIIFAPYNEDEGFPTFEKVIEKCGHRTIRVIFNPPIEEGNKSNSQLKNILTMYSI